MLTKEDLLTQNVLPHIKDVSLKLYKDFSVDILFNRKFQYFFNNGTNITVEFREWGIYHMLSIQHINGRIGKNNFFNFIDNGLELTSFDSDNSIRGRYKKQKERITMFSCTYNSLRECFAFYVPSSKVSNTKNVKVDYIMFTIVSNKGMNIGLRKVGNVYIPITILISRTIDQKRYVNESEFKFIRKLEISDVSGQILETHVRDIISLEQ